MEVARGGVVVSLAFVSVCSALICWFVEPHLSHFSYPLLGSTPVYLPQPMELLASDAKLGLWLTFCGMAAAGLVLIVNDNILPNEYTAAKVGSSKRKNI